MADRRQKFGFRQVGALGVHLGVTQSRFHRRPLTDFLSQLTVEAGKSCGTFFHPPFQIIVRLLQCQRGLAAVGNVPDQHEEPDNLLVVVHVWYVGAEHVAGLSGVVGFLEFEVNAITPEHSLHMRH